MDLNNQMYSLGDGMNFQSFCSDSQLLGLSLQDMIDSDIKEEYEDSSAGTSLDNFHTMDAFDMLNEIPFKLEDDLLGDNSSSLSTGQHAWSNSMVLSNRVENCDSSAYSASAFGNSYLEDVIGATGLMVNPNNVMPVNHQQIKQEQQEQIQLTVNTSQYSNMPYSMAHASPGSYVTHAPVIMTQAHFNNVMTTSAVAANRGIKTLKIVPPLSSPLHQVPSPSASGPLTPTASSQGVKKKPSSQPAKDNGFPKPAYSYSCLISLALKNSHTGCLSVSEIYKFMCDHFPYFRTAPSGWKNSVRHNLSLNKCFEKIEKPTQNGSQRKGCLWAMNPAKVTKMEEEIAKWSRKDPVGIKKGMVIPENLEFLERGEMKKDYNANPAGHDSEDDEDPRTPASVSSQSSQGDDFVDIEGFAAIQDSSLPELNLQVSGGIFSGFGTMNPAFRQNSNYSIASVVPSNGEEKPYNMVVFHNQEGQKVFSM